MIRLNIERTLTTQPSVDTKDKTRYQKGEVFLNEIHINADKHKRSVDHNKNGTEECVPDIRGKKFILQNKFKLSWRNKVGGKLVSNLNY